MGLFYVGCKVLNPAELARSVTITRLMVDTGAEATWIDGTALHRAGIEPRKKDMQFQMANGQIITRSVGYAVLKVDSRAKKHVATGPAMVAAAVPPRFGNLIRVPKHSTTPRRKKAKVNLRRQNILKSK
jgi:hypothetical protein